jgi:hypothetical protein
VPAAEAETAVEAAPRRPRRTAKAEVEPAQQPRWQPAALLFSNPGAQMFPPPERPRGREIAPDLDLTQVLDALVAVVCGCHHPDGRTVFNGELVTVKAIREKHVPGQGVL